MSGLTTGSRILEALNDQVFASALKPLRPGLDHRRLVRAGLAVEQALMHQTE